ncbi:MAG: hypothetical protein J6P74_09115 [Paludibacteraceae bacterium]|nr:hypothetical protein [Paludibacteraceae bacterium]
MNTKLKLLRDLMARIIEDIDAGNSSENEAEIDAAIDMLSTLNHGIKRYSKRWLCDNVLHCSESTFNNYLSMGIIPKGQPAVGFKELSWSIKDMDAAIAYRKGSSSAPVADKPSK